MSGQGLRVAVPTDRCPRCGGGFHCGAHDDTPCACCGIELPASLLDEVRRRWTGCLCLGCLRELAAQATSGRSAAPGQAQALRSTPG